MIEHREVADAGPVENVENLLRPHHAPTIASRQSCYAEAMSRWFVLLALAACGSEDPPPPPDPCNGVVTDVPTLASPHVPEGSTPDWNSNPPTSGPHYAVWAAFDQHYDDLPRGYWLHDLEHGAVVYAYRCDAGCPEVAAQLDAW